VAIAINDATSRMRRGTTSARPSLPAFLAVKEGVEKLSGDPSHGHNCPPGPDRLADGGTLGAKA